LNVACLETVEKGQMPVVTGLLGGKSVQVLRVTGCSGVIVKRSLIEGEQMTGKIGYFMTIDRRALKSSTSYCCHRHAILLRNSRSDVYGRSFVLSGNWKHSGSKGSE